MESIGVKSYRVIWSNADGDFERDFDFFNDSEKNFRAMYDFAQFLKDAGCDLLQIEEKQQVLVEGINC